MQPLQRAAYALILAGILLHLYIGVVNLKADSIGISLIFIFLACLPYLICFALLTLKNSKTLIALGGAVLPLTIDLATYYSVFISPHSSTDALALIFTPFWNMLVFMPIGLTLGYVANARLAKK